MNSYLQEVQRIIDENRSKADSILVINKDGVIEYTEKCNDLNWKEIILYNKGIICKNVLDIYKETLPEEESTVLEALRTGKEVSFEGQTLKADGYTFLLSGTTYPVFDEDGNVKCVVDVTELLDYVDGKGTEDEEVDEVLDSIVTQNIEMMKIKNTLPYIAKHGSTVFIYGETGTDSRGYSRP